MNGRSGYLCVKCLLYEGISCWCWLVVGLVLFCIVNEYFVEKIMWFLLNFKWIGVGKIFKGKF